MAPQYLKTLLIPYNPLASLLSASMDHLQEQRFTTNFGEISFSVSAPKLWNKLPKKTRDIDTVAHFKTALKEHYFTKAIERGMLVGMMCKMCDDSSPGRRKCAY